MFEKELESIQTAAQEYGWDAPLNYLTDLIGTREFEGTLYKILPRLDPRGHFPNLNKYDRESMITRILCLNPLHALRDTFLQLAGVIPGPTMLGPYGETCPECGVDTHVWLHGSGQSAHTTLEAPCQGLLCPFQVEIDVPSGKLVFANDLNKWYPILDDFYINMRSEQKRMTERHAACTGLVTSYVGNTSPDVYQSPNGVIRMVFSPLFRDIPEYLGKHKGKIHTNLWAFCCADSDDIHSRIKEFGGGYPRALYR